ncbi:MAG: FAD binding domain-containing protein [Planctomycetota bacterium]
MILPTFELHQPRTLDELIATARGLRDAGEAFDYMAGGTDVLPNYKNRLNAKPHVVSLALCEGLDEVRADRIGARATIADIARDPVLAEHWPGLVEAARQVSSPPLRNLGTLGGNLLLDTRCFYFNQSGFWRDAKGNCLKAEGDVCLVVPQEEICYATYSGDMAPMVLVLDATLHLAGPDGERAVRARDFWAFDGITRFHKRPEELLTAVSFPDAARGLRTGYRKLRVRDTIEYPVMGVAMGLEAAGGKVARLELAVTGSEAVPLYYGDLGLGGRTIDAGLGEELDRKLVRTVNAYRNVPFPPSYRKAMAGVFARDLLATLAR